MNVQTKKILRDLWVNKARSLLIILAVAIGVAAFGLMLSGRIVLEENLRDVYANTNPAHVVLSLSPFNNGLLGHVRDIEGVETVQAWRVDVARIQAGPDRWLGLEIQTLPDFDSIQINKLRFAENITEPAANSVLLERSLKNVFPVGNTVTIELLDGEQHELTVAGYVNDLSRLPSQISLTAIGYITPATARGLGLNKQYNQLAVRFVDVSTRADIETHTTALIKDLEDSNATVYSAPISTPNKYVLGGNMTSVLFILNSLGILTLILSAFLVTSVMSAVMSQQIPQIGILKSLGARFQQTMSLYFREVLLFGAIALLLAIPMGMIGAYFLADGMAAGMNFDVTRFRLPTDALVLQAISALLAPVLASLAPILAGSRITIREAISNYKPDSTSRVGRFGDLPQIANLSIRNTFRRKGRLALTFVALLLAGAMFIAILGIRQSMRAAVYELQAESNYDISVDLAQPYPSTQIQRKLNRVAAVTAMEAWSVDSGRFVFNDDHLSGSIVLYGVPENTTMTKPAIIHGSWLDHTKRGLFVNADFLDLAPGLQVGSVLTLNIAGSEKEWTIIGSGGRGFTPVAYVYYDDLVAETGLDGYTNRIVLTTAHSDPVSQARVQSDVLSQLTAYDVTGSQTTTESKESSAAQMDILIILLLSMVVLISIVGGLGLAITMSLNVIERTREIGILRSLGGSNRVVRRVVIIEGLVIGLISWAIAVPCSIPLAIWLGNALGLSLLARPLDYIFSVPAVLMWLGLSIVIAVIASIIPAQSAARLTIRDALVYE